MTATARLGSCLVAAAWVLLGGGGAPAGDYKTVQTLLETGETIVGEPIVYPPGQADIVSMIVTMAPGEETGRHQHPVPTFAYILEGEVTVDYEGHGARTYRQGEAFMEAEAVWHNGRNTGHVPVRILAVFMGAKGEADVKRPQ
jgi:quercetin dioxygenase-like cupin family protein